MEALEIELSIVMPCLNEAETLQVCIEKAKSFLESSQIRGEIVISDNGSTDGSQDIALENGARVVHAPEKGYGAALLTGIQSAEGKYVIMGDADDSYDFLGLMPYVVKLREGYDLVMGNRFKGGIKKGAMPFIHKYLGNPVLSFIGRLFFKIPIRDFHCGLRGFKKQSFIKMDLHTTGMEFASEMIVKAALNKMKISEVPTVLSPDGRSRPPHLRTWRDGWRHLRFLLMFSPNWLFLYPGAVITILAAAFSFILVLKPVSLGGITFDIHTIIILAFMLIIGIQLIFFHYFVKIYSVVKGLVPETKDFNKMFNYFNLERGLVLGLILTLLGIVQIAYNFYTWGTLGFGGLEPVIFVRRVLLAVVPLTLGLQTIMYSFMFSIIGIKRNK
ncbi:glycosyltransferase family 2 protein [Maribacter sp. 2-571]|uniref:glycosyltransferase family 2 protein n=1 Tax=Maribacter sp. 2-571 TaxID=3417569 RepID=UPI003D343FDE